MFDLFSGPSKHSLYQQRDKEARKALEWQMAHKMLLVKWNALVDKINGLGGENFLNNAKIGGPSQFTDDELRSLLQLVHPDKHGGKQSAIELTQKINALRDNK